MNCVSSAVWSVNKDYKVLREERDCRNWRRHCSCFSCKSLNIVPPIGTTVRRSPGGACDTGRRLEAVDARSARRSRSRRWVGERRPVDVASLGPPRRPTTRPHGGPEMRRLRWIYSRVLWPVAFRLTSRSQPTINLNNDVIHSEP